MTRKTATSRRPAKPRRAAPVKRPRGNRSKAAAAKRRAKHQGRWAIVLRTLVTAAAIPVLAVAFIFVHDHVVRAAVFHLAAIEIEGLQRLDRQTILNQGGLRPGQSALTVNLTQIRQRLLAHPWVRDAAVGRRLPDAIWIHVQEHAPMARTSLARHVLILTDRGDVFRDPGTVATGPLPTLTGLSYTDIAAGSRLEPEVGKPLQAVLQQQTALNDRFKWGGLKRIHVDRDLGLTLYPDRRVQAIRLGFDHFDTKWQRLDVLFAQWHRVAPAGATLNQIDVTGNRRGIVQLAPNTPEQSAGKENQHAKQ